MTNTPAPEKEDLYAYQRSELIDLLKSLANRHQPLVVNGQTLLVADDVYVVMQKINQKHHFSRKEKHALIEAGFDIEQVFPGL